jgi:hypothetical protein
MKKIIFVIMTLVAFSVNAQNNILQDIHTVSKDIKETVSTAVDTTKKVAKDAINTVDTSSNFRLVYSDAKGAIAGLAKALKVGAEHVYEVLVRQQIVNSLTWLITSIILIFTPLIWRKKIWDKLFPSEDEDAVIGLGFLLFFVVIVPMAIGFLILLTHLQIIITGFVNPEFGAIQQIFEFLKNNTGNTIK